MTVKKNTKRWAIALVGLNVTIYAIVIAVLLCK